MGCNNPLDLHLEHMYRNFKDNISRVSPRLIKSSVQKTTRLHFAMFLAHHDSADRDYHFVAAEN